MSDCRHSFWGPKTLQGATCGHTWSVGSLHLSSVPTTLSSLCGLPFGNTRGPQIAATSSGIHPVQAGHKNHLCLCWMKKFSPSCRLTATQGPAGVGQAETNPSPTRAASTRDGWGSVKQGQGMGQHQHLQAVPEVYLGADANASTARCAREQPAGGAHALNPHPKAPLTW